MQSILSNFTINSINILLAITGVFITALTMVVAPAYIERKRKGYYLLNIIYILSFILAIFSKNWVVFFISWEMVTITTTLMLLWKGRGLAGQYFILQFVGSSILLYVIIVAIHRGYPQIMAIEETWLQNMFVLGLGMKSAIFGLQFWLPAVHSQAPVPVSAILSGWVVKLGFITCLKIIPDGNHLLLTLGLLMVFYGGIKALVARDYKVLLAYSSISQLGYIAIGIGSGTIYGYLGSIIHITAHALAKSGLFIGSGYLIKEYGSRCIYDFKNVWHRQKSTALNIFISTASLMGMPLMAGYLSKSLIKYGFKNGWLLTAILYLASLLTILYSIRILYWTLFKNLLGGNNDKNVQGRKYYLQEVEFIILFIPVLLIIITGVFPGLLTTYIKEKPVDLHLIKGFIEFFVMIMISFILMQRKEWFKNNKGHNPSLDLLFNKVNRYLFSTARYLYHTIYQDFQYQLLWIAVFVIFFLLWGLTIF